MYSQMGHCGQGGVVGGFLKSDCELLGFEESPLDLSCRYVLRKARRWKSFQRRHCLMGQTRSCFSQDIFQNVFITLFLIATFDSPPF